MCHQRPAGVWGAEEAGMGERTLMRAPKTCGRRRRCEGAGLGSWWVVVERG